MSASPQTFTMAYFIPSYFQKRILRYALSRLELLDTDALDIEKLDLVWGKKTTIELRDVGLQLRKLAVWLNLPAWIILNKGTITLLRLTVPADLYASGILLEIEGVDVGAALDTNRKDGDEGRRKKRKAGLPRGVKANMPRSTQPQVHDPGGQSRRADLEEKEGEEAGRLPTTVDLAESFLQNEGPRSKEELELAMAKSRSMNSSQLSDFGEDTQEVGLGTTISLPAFLSDFLQGIVDRLQLRISRLRVDIDMNLDLSSISSTGSSLGNQCPVTFRLKIDSINVNSVSKDNAKSTSFSSRKIVLSNLRGHVVSETSLFTTLSQMSGPPSPVIYQKLRNVPALNTYNAGSNVSSSGSGADLGQSSVLMSTTQDTSSTLPPRNRIDSPNVEAQHQTLITSVSDIAESALLQHPNPHELQNAFQNDHVISFEQSRATNDAFHPSSSYDSDQLSSHFTSRSPNRSADLVSAELDLSKDLTLSSEFRKPDKTKNTIENDLRSSPLPPRPPDPYDPKRFAMAGSWDSPLQEPSTLPATIHHQKRAVSSESLPMDSSPGTPPFADSTSPDDLMESRFFSHEEAESMYMSAVSKTFETREEGQSVTIDQTLQNQSKVASRLNEHEEPTSEHYSESTGSGEGREHFTRDLEAETKEWKDPEIDASFTSSRASEPIKPTESQSPSSSGSDSIEETPARDTASQGSSSCHQSNIPARVTKEFLSVDLLSVTLPSKGVCNDEEVHHSAHRNHPISKQYEQTDVPGAFSTHSFNASSYFTSKSQSTSNLGQQAQQASENSELTPQSGSSDAPISLSVGEVAVCGDLGFIKLMILMGQQLRTIQWNLKPSKRSRTGPETISNTSQPPIEIHINKFSLQLVDVLRGALEMASIWNTPSLTSTQTLSTPSNILLAACVNHLGIRKATSTSLTRFDISLQTFRFGYATEDIFFFERGSKLKDSNRDFQTTESPDIKISIEQTQEFSEINLSTLPLNVKLDLAQLDETFSWFGGLSGVLELGNSMMSTVTVIEPRPKVARPRGVRFEAPRKTAFVEQPPRDISRTKVHARVGGLHVKVQGKSSSLLLNSTAMKLVSRSEYIAIQVDKIKLSGPHLLDSENIPILVDFANTRLEYLTYPKENDIDRLLDLLSPSRDKEEQDDGILLDTLISQRQQGGVVRLTIETCSGILSDPTCFDHFSVLAEEFAKLSTVAKYLPEDDRPGILALCLVRKLNFDANINARFGIARLSASNIEIAQVTLPSLFLLAANTIWITRGDEELVGEALPVDKMAMTRKVPSVGVRFVGDEMEPIIKVKLWNTRMDYHVSTLMAIMGMKETATGDIIIADMVSSIATLKAQKTPPRLSTQSSFRSGKSSTSSRNMAFEISIRDSALGLNPRKSPSKALFLLSDAKISGNIPNDDRPDTVGILSINKALLMVVDKLESLADAPQPDELPAKFMTQTSHFMNLGYVSVCEISAAKVTWKIKPSCPRSEGSVEIEVRDELFILDTCADSTHTLQSVMNGLNPPSPPSTALKYRTEVGPVQDMLASMSAEGFLSSRTVDTAKNLTSSDDEVAVAEDDTTSQLNLIESVFGLGLEDEEGGNIGESFLDDDLENLTNPSAARHIEDKTLLESYHEQQQIDSNLEKLEFHDDHFGADSGKGKAHKWNSDRNTFETGQIKLGGIPFRLNVRDVHIIWNLYEGYDWQTTRDTISQAVADVEHKAAERLARLDKRKADEDDAESVVGDFLFNSIYIGIPANRDPRDLAGQVNRNIDDLTSETGSYATSTTARSSPSRRVNSNPRMRKKRLRLGRSKRHKMSFELKGVSVDLAVFAPGSSETQSSVDIRIEDLDIFDNVPTSAWRKFATYMHDAGQRQIGESMVHIEILTVKPVPDLAASEIVMTVSFIFSQSQLTKSKANLCNRSKSSPSAFTSTKTPSTS